MSFAVIDGPRHRSSASIFWQQGSVDIDAALRRNRQDILGKNLAISGDDQQVRVEGSQAGDTLGSVDTFRLENWNRTLLGDFPHAQAGLAGRAPLLTNGAVR